MEKDIFTKIDLIKKDLQALENVKGKDRRKALERIKDQLNYIEWNSGAKVLDASNRNRLVFEASQNLDYQTTELLNFMKELLLNILNDNKEVQAWDVYKRMDLVVYGLLDVLDLLNLFFDNTEKGTDM
ncbi:hypothetical protein O0Z71_05280 [Ligilactobacillus saerimneri]|uniref:hypothetical protein n=1 Tax=Ligilactobacillus saerimneri TaxID=228229 RepID=UPI0022A7B133|nr:hypothetical protein [Ligilactobacillus saerimneri]MCZ0891851.1 hypothetical protein [Ligilactobacillus saerimneri]